MADEPQAPEQGIKTFSACVPAPIPVKKHAKVRRLKLSQQAFVKAIADPEQPTFGNATRAYAVSHPASTSRQGQAVSAHYSLKNPNVQSAVVSQLQAAGVNLQDEAAWGIATAKARHNLTAHNAYIQTLGTLTGVWKQRQEVEQVDTATKDFIRRTVSERVLHEKAAN